MGNAAAEQDGPFPSYNFVLACGGLTYESKVYLRRYAKILCCWFK
jgi:hypothetical protein